jgi:hypothetical protein
MRVERLKAAGAGENLGFGGKDMPTRLDFPWPRLVRL